MRKNFDSIVEEAGSNSSTFALPYTSSPSLESMNNDSPRAARAVPGTQTLRLMKKSVTFDSSPAKETMESPKALTPPKNIWGDSTIVAMGKEAEEYRKKADDAWREAEAISTRRQRLQFFIGVITFLDFILNMLYCEVWANIPGLVGALLSFMMVNKNYQTKIDTCYDLSFMYLHARFEILSAIKKQDKDPIGLLRELEISIRLMKSRRTASRETPDSVPALPLGATADDIRRLAEKQAEHDSEVLNASSVDINP